MTTWRAVCIAAVWLFSCVAAERSFQPASVSFQQLALPNKAVMKVVEDALAEVGVLVVTEIPGFAGQRKTTLGEAAECVQAMDADDDDYLDLHTEMMPDGTKRLSVVAQTKWDSSVALKGLHGEKCRRFARDVAPFRETVTSVSKIFCERLDEVLGTGFTTKLFRDVQTNTFMRSMTDIMRKGIQLEHFHTYNRNEDSTLNTLDLHTDHGLFIAVAPALIASGGPDHGFLIQLNSGEIVRLELQDENALMFILGDGMSNWIAPATGVSLRPTPHIVQVPTNDIRSWYGRMFLPPSSAFVETKGTTFGAIRQEMRRALGDDVSFSVCTDGYELFTRDLASGCETNEILCWGECRTAPSCSSGEVAECIDPRVTSEISICDPAEHNGICAPQCIASSNLALFNDGNNSRGNDFCNGFNVAMYMAGFTGPGDSTDACLTFLFIDFVLDSPVKYAGACFGTILLGICVEFVVKLRRRYKAKHAGKQHLKSFKAGILSLYALQVTLGYLAMLIAMTYAYVFFIMIVMGLVIGYGLFNMNIPVTEYTDPCCNYETTTSETSSDGTASGVENGNAIVNNDKQVVL